MSWYREEINSASVTTALEQSAHAVNVSWRHITHRPVLLH